MILAGLGVFGIPEMGSAIPTMVILVPYWRKRIVAKEVRVVFGAATVVSMSVMVLLCSV